MATPSLEMSCRWSKALAKTGSLSSAVKAASEMPLESAGTFSIQPGRDSAVVSREIAGIDRGLQVLAVRFPGTDIAAEQQENKGE